MTRKQTREVKIGSLKIGNNNPILIQSMTNTKTKDVKATDNRIIADETARHYYKNYASTWKQRYFRELSRLSRLRKASSRMILSNGVYLLSLMRWS